jgi:SagB-type dehydrogenase family enzyme
MTKQLTNNNAWPGVAVEGASFESLETTEITARLYRESRRRAADLKVAANEVPDFLRPQTTLATSRYVALPPPLAESYPLQQSLLARGAVRVYDPAPFSLAQLGTILHTAVAGDRQNWPQEEAAGVGLQLKVVAWRVEGVEPAIWQYEPERHELAYIGPAPAAHEADSLTLQHEFTAAPVIIFITGNLAAACARYGSWGHRQLLFRAGAAGQRLWFGAIGVGLAGTVFAGFLPRAANRFARVDGYLEASLLAFAVGRPPQFLGRAHSAQAIQVSKETDSARPMNQQS